MTKGQSDLLVNAERPAGDKPAPSAERADAIDGYWRGSATEDRNRWRQRALVAEAENVRLLALLKREAP
jgi:hypothetical protein